MRQPSTIMKELVRYYHEGYASIPDDLFKKIKGDIKPGKSLSIYWDDGETDFGYVFSLPDQDYELGDCMFHVTIPDRSGGVEEWGHLYELITNDKVKEIIIQ